jgi:gamma-glutamyltranspeptidase/glutathione hydrolase
MRRTGTLVLIVIAGLCLLAQTPGAEQRERLLRPIVRGKRAVVAAGAPYATEAGLRLLHAGGNAVDAGVAATFAAAVTEYSHFGFGGEAPVLIHAKGRVYAVSGTGVAPKLATAGFYRQRQPDPSDQPVIAGAKPGRIPSTGILSAIVPGMVDGMITALAEFGTKSFAEVIQPALDLADGYPIDETRASYIARYRAMIEKWPDAARVYLPGGQAPRPGDIFRQPDLARTLRGMMEAERRALAGGQDRKVGLTAAHDYFYKGPVAREIDRFMRANNGFIRSEDMANFHTRVEEPVAVNFHGYAVYKAGFWSQSPVMLQTLNLLEGFDLKKMGSGSADYLHTLVEAMKLAYADRDSFYADPSFAKIPAATLLSKPYAQARAALIDPARANNTARPGSPDGLKAMHPSFYGDEGKPVADPSRDTTCVDVVDSNGIMFSATPSGAWLPAVIAGETGVPLAQRLQAFLLIPGHPNELQPGKRPRITLSPTLVLKDGKPYLALSTPGGDNQDQALIQVLLNVIEFDMNVEEAIEAPRVESAQLVSSFDNHMFQPGILYLDERFDAKAMEILKQRGHIVRQRSRWSSGSAPVLIAVNPATGAIEAAADPYGYRYAEGW